MPDKIIYEDKENKKVTIELPEEPASISDLAKVIIECREISSLGTSDLSNEGIYKLLETAFYLSMRSDEGRYPCLRIVSGRQNERLTIKLKTPLSFSNVHELRRISPIAESQDFAVFVSENKDGELLCLGLTNIGHGSHVSLPGRPEITSLGVPVLFRAWIEGPGHLYVSEAGQSFEYRAGRVRLVYPALSFVPKLRGLTQSIGHVLHRKSIDAVSDIPDAHKYFGGYSGVTSIVDVALRKILHTCLGLRHGGAFVILPEDDSIPDSYDISCKYLLESPDLGEDIANYWATHIETCYAKNHGVEEYDKKLGRSYSSKARLLNNLDAVAHLTAADGCVVLTNTLRILGFGGSILVSEEDCKKSISKFKLSECPCSIDEFLNSVGGQRHQSAARLIIKHNGIVVFVISQDGELTTFLTDDEEYVRVYKPVDPSDLPGSN